jgi:hypothetical protein
MSFGLAEEKIRTQDKRELEPIKPLWGRSPVL